MIKLSDIAVTNNHIFISPDSLGFRESNISLSVDFNQHYSSAYFSIHKLKPFIMEVTLPGTVKEIFLGLIFAEHVGDAIKMLIDQYPMAESIRMVHTNNMYVVVNGDDKEKIDNLVSALEKGDI